MEDPKHRFPGRTREQPDLTPKPERRRMSRVVHDHKGNATVEWHDAPADYQRQPFEIEGGRSSGVVGVSRSAGTGGLALEAEDTHNPYMRTPEGDRKRPGQRTDLRKLSAWIKMMRSLEEAKKRDREED